MRAGGMVVMLTMACVAIGFADVSSSARASDISAEASAAAAALLAAYPEQLAGRDGGDIIWRDGTRMAIDDGAGPKPHAAWEGRPDLKDMLRYPYTSGPAASAPAEHVDPGRARHRAFFEKMYGACSESQSPPNMTTIVWLPGKAAQKIRVTTINGVDRRLAAVSAELDKLSAEFDIYLKPSEGTYNCRSIAGTQRRSPHSYGIAIDIATARSDYWVWWKRGAGGSVPYRNRMPIEIVRIFEAHGFIWGGKWYHYDTMHFEYRPELLPPVAELPAQ
jgi:D-alanyl-D-alanine carboxypeptidase